jgi:hypothetical protein
MSDRPDLSGFLEAAAKSFGQAQADIGLPEGMRPSMLITEAELAVKAGMRLEGGALRIEPVSTASSVKGGIQPEALSTITVKYVAARSEGGGEPVRTPDDVVKEVKDRGDVADLGKVLGDLRVSARFIPDLDIWTAVVVDDRQRIVRTINVPDRK